MAFESFDFEPRSTVATGADIGGSPDVGIPLPCTPDGSSSTPVSLSSINFIGPITLLAILNVIVIFGNGLVVVAVFTQSQLRTVTNTFIVSLAVSDLLLGIVVLPFSSANELLHYWVFGTIWCSAWLAVDVWLCTASILNLCAISLDRYLAISRPFRYPVLMSPSRAKLTVGLVWLLALAICSPPLLGWKTKSSSNVTDAAWIQFHLDAITSDPSSLNFTLVDDSDTEILNYSTVFGNNGTQPSAKTDRATIVNTSTDETIPCRTESSFPTCELNSEPGYIIYSACGSFWIPMLVMSFFYVKIYRTAVKATEALRRGVVRTKTDGMTSSNSDMAVNLRVHRGGGGNHPVYKQYESLQRGCNRMSAEYSPTSSTRGDNDTGNGISPLPVGIECLLRTACTPVYEELPRSASTEGAPRADGESTTGSGNSVHQRRPNPRMQVRLQLRRLNREKKAAKTVGIIVGCFIFCWAPFFTVYLLGAFCHDCSPEKVFSLFFWLGYCNSAINPLIYGLCSRDFRSAFTRLLLCRRRRSQPQLTLLISKLHNHPVVHSSVRDNTIYVT